MIEHRKTSVTYRGDGVTTSFPFSFDISSADNIHVAIYDTATEVTTDITRDYFVDAATKVVHYPGYAPGQAPAASAQPPKLPNGKTITIYRKTPINQLTNLGTKYPLPSIEAMSDKATAILQEFGEQIGRSVKVPHGNPKTPEQHLTELNHYVSTAKQAEANARLAAEALYGALQTLISGNGNLIDARQYLAMFQHLGIRNVKEFGASGDGVTDDTRAIQKALAAGGTVYLPEGDYLISEGLMVNTATTTLRGQSTKARLKASHMFPEDGYMITFYNNEVDWDERYKTTREHGNFSLSGRAALWSEDIGYYDLKVNGIRFGMPSGDPHEGAVACQVFRNIDIFNVKKALTYTSHVYKNLHENICMANSLWSIYSEQGNNDNGEALTFVNCAFWGANLMDIYTIEMFFYGCTLHLTQASTIMGRGHGLNFGAKGLSMFTNCHFEFFDTYGAIHKNVIMATWHYVIFRDCTWVTAKGINFKEAFFRANRAATILLDGCTISEFLQSLNAVDIATTICKGVVYIENTPFYRVIDMTKQIPKVYDEQYNFAVPSILNDIAYIGDFTPDNTKLSQNKEGAVRIVVTERPIHPSPKSMARSGVGKISPVGNHKMVRHRAKFTVQSNVNQVQISINQNKTNNYGVIFLKPDGSEVKAAGVDYFIYTEITNPNIGDVLEYDYLIPIPPGTSHVFYGVCINDNTTKDVTIDINECYIELI